MATCFTTIMIPMDQRAALRELKAHHRQAYHEVIGQLMQARFDSLKGRSKRSGAGRRRA